MGIETTKIPKKKKKNEQHICEPWGNANALNICAVKVPGEKKENRKIL